MSYDPNVGRWTARDPLGFEGGDTNLYRYVGNNPTNFIDPSGRGIGDDTGIRLIADPYKKYERDYIINRLRKNLGEAKYPDPQGAVDELNKLFDITSTTRGGQVLDNCWAFCAKVQAKTGPFKHIKVKTKGWWYPLTAYNSISKESLGHGALQVTLPDGTIIFIDDGWWGGNWFSQKPAIFYPEDVWITAQPNPDTK